MKRLALTAMSIAIAALAFATLPFASDLARADTSKSSSISANASFSSFDGDVETFLFVSASHFTNVFHDPPGRPGDPFTGSSVFVDIFQCDPSECTGFFGFAEIDPSQFQIDDNLTSATLNAVVEVCDFDVTCFDVEIDLLWDGAGQLSRSNGNNHFRTDGFISNCRFKQSSRSAEVTGSVLDTIDFTGGETGFGGLSASEDRCSFID